MQEANFQKEYVIKTTDQLDQFSKLLDVTLPNCLMELHGLVQVALQAAMNERLLQRTIHRSKSMEKILQKNNDTEGLKKVQEHRQEQIALSLNRLNEILEKIEKLKELLFALSGDLEGLKVKIRIHKKLAKVFNSSEQLQLIKELKETLRCHRKETRWLLNIVVNLEGDMKKMKKKLQLKGA